MPKIVYWETRQGNHGYNIRWQFGIVWHLPRWTREPMYHERRGDESNLWGMHISWRIA